ncbi:hypothetical protein HOY82DRAFT_643741 [Tuber indicum]|nr:hypothetical protein HOY82DRAFT_643741 [Tuber indicum]
MSMLGSPEYVGGSGPDHRSGPVPIIDSIKETRLKKEFSLEDFYLNLNKEKENKFLDVPASLIGDPDYNKIVHITDSNVEKINFMNCYSALRVSFTFPDNIKYPPLPVNLDKNITIYPLSGESLITGLEFFSAKNVLNDALIEMGKDLDYTEQLDLRKQYCIKIIHGSAIPFKEGYKPFYNVINELQANRRMHPKKSANERIYKDLGNMLYGKLVSGINNNRKYDARTRFMKALIGNDITNPIIGT